MARERSSFRKMGIWGTIAFCFLLAGYLCLLSILSIWIGVTAAPQSGFWVPILAGATCLIPVFWGLYRITKLLVSQMAEKEIIRI